MRSGAPSAKPRLRMMSFLAPNSRKRRECCGGARFKADDCFCLSAADDQLRDGVITDHLIKSLRHLADWDTPVRGCHIENSVVAGTEDPIYYHRSLLLQTKAVATTTMSLQLRSKQNLRIQNDKLQRNLQHFMPVHIFCMAFSLHISS